jgi:hypothetical protein
VETIGAGVTVTVGNMRMVQEVAGVAGYLSSSDPRLHFGLGERTNVDEIEIRWPDRKVTRLRNVKTNQFLEVFSEKR